MRVRSFFTRQMVPFWALPALAMLVAADRAAGQDSDTRPGIAVLPFDVAQLTGESGAGLNFGLQQILATELGANPALRMIDRRALNDVMREIDLHGSGRVDSETAARIGRIVGARYMIGNSYFDNAGHVRLDARIIDVETTEVINAARASGSRNDLYDLLRDLAREVMHRVDLPPLPDAIEEERRSQIVPMEAIDLFSFAVDYDEDGNVQEAVKTLNLVIERWPGYSDAVGLRDKIMRRVGDLNVGPVANAAPVRQERPQGCVVPRALSHP